MARSHEELERRTGAQKEHAMRGKPLVLLAVVAAAMVLVPATALARPKGVPAGSILAVNVTQKVTNDEDSGRVGYWALLNYEKRVQVWKVPRGTYLAIVNYVGKWTTFEGALSPNAGVPQRADGHGTFKGGYRATFAATDFTRVRGYIGTYDFGGTQADVLLGTYGAQAGITPSFNWTTAYFTGVSDYKQLTWGWTYKYKVQRWRNLSTGMKGDIVL